MAPRAAGAGRGGGTARPPEGGGADGGGEVQGEGPVLRKAGADSTAERAAGRGPTAWRALAYPRHGEQPGPERGRGRNRSARRGVGGLLGLLGLVGRAGVRETAGTAGAAGTVIRTVIRAAARAAVRAAVWVFGAAGAGRLGAGIGLGAGFPQRLVEGLLVQAGGVERVAAAAVRQGQPGRDADVLLGHHVAPVPGGQGDRGPRGHQVGAHAVHAERTAHRADLAQRGVRQVDAGKAVAGRGHLGRQGGGVRGEAGYETRRVGFEGEPAADHLGPFGPILTGRDLHRQPEPVQQLRAELAFLRVHGADQQEPRGVPDRDALALHVVHAQRGRVEQQVDQVVVEQVDLVHVEHAAVRRGQQPGLEGGRARGQHALDVQRAGQPVLGGPDRELGQRDRAQLGCCRAVRAGRAGGIGRGGIAGVRAAGNHRHRRQQGGQPADHGRLRGALLAADQDPADGRGHRVEQQRQLQVRHPDDAGERVRVRLMITGGRHRASPSRVSSPEVEELIGSRSLWLPVETATSRVTPGHSCGTAPDSHRRSSASLPQHSMTYPPDAVPDSTGLPAGYTSRGPKSLLSSPGAHVASHSAGNSQLTRVA